MHPHPLPPDGVGSDGLVKKQRIGAQAAQIKGLPLLIDDPGQRLRQPAQYLISKFQMRVVIWHSSVDSLLSQSKAIHYMYLL